jgi:hypothetical protein
VCTPSRARHGCIATRRGIPIGELSQADGQSLGDRFGDIPRIRFWGLSPPGGIAVFALQGDANTPDLREFIHNTLVEAQPLLNQFPSTLKPDCRLRSSLIGLAAWLMDGWMEERRLGDEESRCAR